MSSKKGEAERRKTPLAAPNGFMANGQMDSGSADKNDLAEAQDTHRDFRDALGQFATGVTVITTLDAAGRALGITVNSFSSVSLEPPLILWSLERSSYVATPFTACTHFAVNVLAADQKDLALRFALTDHNKYDGVATEDGLHGLPLIKGALAHFECGLDQTFPGGDHVILLGRVERFSKSQDGDPLIFHKGELAGLNRKT